MPEPPGDSKCLSVDVKDHDDWVGTVEVGHDQGSFFWRVTNGKGVLLQDDQEQRDANDFRAEMAVLLRFLLATADKPLSVFCDPVTGWALLNRTAIKQVLDEL